MVCATSLPVAAVILISSWTLGMPGHTRLATLLNGGACSVSVADVVDNAAQADADYPMKNIGAVEAGETAKTRSETFPSVPLSLTGPDSS